MLVLEIDLQSSAHTRSMFALCDLCMYIFIYIYTVHISLYMPQYYYYGSISEGGTCAGPDEAEDVGRGAR